MIIKGKVSSYGLNITNSSNITIKGLFFFSSTFSADSSDSVNIEDCTFSFPSTSKRMLGNLETPLASSLGLSGKKVNNSTIKKCLFEYTDGDALRVYGDNNTIENNYFQHIDYSVAELPGCRGVAVWARLGRFAGTSQLDRHVPVRRNDAAGRVA